MKKQLIAAAVAAAFAAGATAAQVEVYGSVDLGYEYDNTKDFKGETTHSFAQVSGVNYPSRWGLKGSEDLGNGYSVSFKLESAFDADTGALSETRLFHRESRLTVGTPFGEFSFGRMGALSSSSGTYDLIAANATVFDGGFGDAFGYNDLFYADFARMDNTITYMSPTAYGFTGYLQYSSKVDQVEEKTGDEFEGSSTRYWGAGLSYANGPLTVVFSAEQKLNPGTTDKDTTCFSLGGNYAFPNGVKVYLAGQVGKNVTDIQKKFDGNDRLANADGFNVVVGTTVPVAGGSLLLSAQYGKTESNDAIEVKCKSYTVGAIYDYNFSNRTGAYVGVGYNKKEITGATDDARCFTVVTGVHHSF